MRSAFIVVGWGLTGFLSQFATAQPVPLAPAPTGVQVTREQGYEFVTVHAPNVAPAPLAPTNISPTQGASANYAFRISRTETTYGDWLPFVTAYSHWFPIDGFFPQRVLGHHIVYTGSSAEPFVVNPTMRNAGCEMSWRMAAIYCNWLHNDRADNPQAFLSGAYDVSTFGSYRLPSGQLVHTDQVTHSPGARFWIPTYDELVVSMYWDPNRYGQGMGGWWDSNNHTNQALPYTITYDADEVELLHSDVMVVRDYYYNMYGPVASFQSVTTPWGLFDAAGSVSEWTEGSGGDPVLFRASLGSNYYNPYGDILGSFASRGANPDDYTRWTGLRLAASIPSPSGVALAILFATLGSSRSNRS